MREFFHSVKFKIILCIAALLLGLMTYVAVAAGTQTLPEQVISTVTVSYTHLDVYKSQAMHSPQGVPPSSNRRTLPQGFPPLTGHRRIIISGSLPYATTPRGIGERISAS